MAAVLNMEPTKAEKKVLKIMYRKGAATKQEIEASFRRSTASAGRNVDKLLNKTLKSLVKKGNLDEVVFTDDGTDGYEWVTGRQSAEAE